MSLEDDALRNAALGLSEEHIIFDLPEAIKKPVHKDIVEPFLKLQADAKEAGFDLQIVSGFRDFSRQLMIWTAKTNGERDLIAEDGSCLSFAALSNQQLLQAIMRWSAIPGASRHHWGTDIDVYDAKAIDDDYNIQLVDTEVYGSGPFTALHDWLDEKMAHDEAHGFFRPYTKEAYETCGGGVSPERWHLSYAPLSAKFQSVLDQESLFAAWEGNYLTLLDEIKSDWEDIWKKYIWVDKNIYPEKYRSLLVG